MQKIILILLLCFGLTGCSALKIITAPFKPTRSNLPQQTEQSKNKDVCRGEAKFNEDGEIIYCSRGYYSYAEGYSQKERKMTLKEKIIQFFESLSGYLFWIVLGLLIFCPSLLGFIVGRIIEGVFGISKKALVSTIKGVQSARKSGKDLNDSLGIAQDEKEKAEIRKIKDKLGL